MSETQNEITVATRTRNRPNCLERVLNGLLAQNFRRFEWVVLNDGGEQSSVDAVTKRARREGVDVTVIHNDQPAGRGAAANQAVRAGSAPLVLLHDDDDRIKPDYLARTSDFLKTNPAYSGVVTQIEAVIESPDLEEQRRWVLEPYLYTLRLVDMAERNLFAPIGFLYRRKAFEAAGGYDEDVPVLEDWVFNLKLMMKGDVGVVPEVLAEYFWRSSIDVKDPISNTVVAGRSDHLDYDAIIRNRFLRADLDAGCTGLGWLLNPPNRLAAARINEAVTSINRLRNYGRSTLRSLTRLFGQR